MAAPTVELWIGGVWLDVTGQVLNAQRVTISRQAGWRAVDSSPPPGLCEFVLDNTGDPGPWSVLNPAATYYGQVGLGTLVRVTKSSSTRFYGEISAFRPDADPTGNFGWVEVEAKGALGRFTVGGGQPLHSPAYTAYTSPTNDSTRLAYWPIEEESDATMVTSPTSSPQLQINGEVSLGASTAAPATARMATFGTGGGFLATVPSYTGTGEIKVCGLWALPSSGELPDQTIMWRIGFDGGTVDWIDLKYATGGVLVYHVYAGGALVDVTTAYLYGAYIVGDFFFLSSEFRQVGADFTTLVLAVSDTTTGLSGGDTVTGQTLGTVTQISVALTDCGGASFGQLCVGNDTSAFANFISATATGGLGTLAFTGESGAGRILRLANENGVSSSIRSVTANADGMGEQKIATLVQCWTDAMEADGGMLADARGSLSVRYVDRFALYNQLPTLTLDYAAKQLHSQLRPDTADQLTRNDVTVSRDGGGSARAVIRDGDPYHWTTEDPPDGIGDRNFGMDLILQSDILLSPSAGWYAHLGATKEPHFGEVTVKLHAPQFTADSALTADVLAVDIGDMIAVDNQPSWCPPDPVQLLCWGYRESIDTVEHEITFSVAPAYPWEVWLLDTGGGELAAPLTTGGTSMKFATSLGPEASTTNEPYHVSIGGEAMTVTAMTTDTAALIAAGTVAHGNNASVSPGLPAGMTADSGHLMVLLAAIRGSGTATVNTPSGWTVLAANGNMSAFGRYYTTGDTAPTVTFAGGAAGDDTSARIVAFSGLSMEHGGGWQPTLKQSPGTADQLNGSAQNIAYPALYVFRSGCVVFYAGWKQDDWTSVATIAGATEDFDNFTTTGNDQGIVLDHVIQTSAADIAAGSFTVTGGAGAISRASLFALRPLQTATVTRSVNGVVATHAVGDAVHAWRLGAIAL